MLTFAEWLLFAVTGRILIYLWMQFPLPPASLAKPFLEKLHKCDLCSGVWIYAILAVALQVSLFGYNNVVTQAATGAVTSYLVHVFVIGWKDKFQPPIVI